MRPTLDQWEKDVELNFDLFLEADCTFQCVEALIAIHKRMHACTEVELKDMNCLGENKRAVEAFLLRILTLLHPCFTHHNFFNSAVTGMWEWVDERMIVLCYALSLHRPW